MSLQDNTDRKFVASPRLPTKWNRSHEVTTAVWKPINILLRSSTSTCPAPPPDPVQTNAVPENALIELIAARRSVPPTNPFLTTRHPHIPLRPPSTAVGVTVRMVCEGSTRKSA